MHGCPQLLQDVGEEKPRMENRRPLRKKLQSVLLAAAWGAVLFAAFALALIVADHYWHKHIAELAFAFRLTVWAIILQAGISEPPAGTFWATPGMYDLYCMVLSACLGALLFAMVAAFWQFL